MEKTVEDFSYGLLAWQVFMFVLIVAIMYFIFKLYRGIMTNLD